jgi:uroporphyrin-III C-methyltransferase / precorrin-2 dehydrogenase / sirohydrochlorin ferrochelatase
VLLSVEREVGCHFNVVRCVVPRHGAGTPSRDDGPVEPPPYPSGLILAGRRVLVVGGGHVAQRRVPQLIAVGAEVVLVSPQVRPAVEGLASAGEITWLRRGFEDADLDGAWYVIAATDDPAVNEAVSAGAERRRVFCVRSDDATRASAWTPAVGRHAGVTVAVLGNREPRRSAAVRDEILEGLREGTIVARHQRDRSPGVVLVGGGPGDPELISVAGRKALMEADVVVADRLAPRELLGELPADVELVDVAKLPRGRAAQQEEINRVIVDRARAGKRVVRFKGGDSFVFGRGFEEVEACRAAGVPVTVVPGLTSPVAVPALAGIPVTHRGVAHDFTVISGHLPPGHPDSLTDWEAVARLHGTLLLMMAVENAPAIADALLAGGREPATPVAVVCDGSMPGERTVLSTLESLAADLAREAVQPPAIIVVGDVVAVARPDHYQGHDRGLHG